MTKTNCCVVGCHNSTYQLIKWKKKVCTLHGWKHGTGRCICEPPFKLHPFPSELKNSNLRRKWIQAVNREELVNQQWVNWEPRTFSRICSKHFVDLEPSSSNPIPTLNLGRTRQGLGNIRPPLTERGSNSNEQKNNEQCKDEAQPGVDVLQAMERLTDKPGPPECLRTNKRTKFSSAGHLPVNHDHTYHIKRPNGTRCECESCRIRVHRINKPKKQNEALKDDFDKLLQDQTPKNSIASSLLTSDAKVSFYTGLPNKETFYAIFSQIEPRAQKLQLWQDVKDMTLFTVHKFKKFIKKPGTVRKLPLVDDYFLTLMKLRLNLCMEDLGERFGLTAARCSQVFKTWIKFLRTELESLVFFPEREIIQANMPKAFREQASKVRVIIDCSNVYIKKSNKLKGHCHTQSHNIKANRKFLMGITPQGHIAYMSKAWSGITSDKHVIRHSGILNYLEPGDQVMADRKFPVEEELLQRHATLVIPPSKNAQKGKKKRGLASLRIHIELAINRIKWFRILKTAMSISMLPLLDDIIIVCGALCNLLPSLAES